MPEDAPLEPRSTYAATKLAQEHLAGAWARQTGGTVWALRYHNVYGPRMPRDTPYAGVASIFRSALAAGRAAPGAGGRPATARLRARHRRGRGEPAGAARRRPRIALAPVNVCSGEPHTVVDLAHELAAAMGGPAPVVVGGGRPADVRHVVADPARAARLLGFTARAGFAAGVADFATAPLRAPAALRTPSSSRWLTASAVAAWAASHHAACPRAAVRGATSSQTANGSQIRSTSALLIPDRSGEQDRGRRERRPTVASGARRRTGPSAPGVPAVGDRRAPPGAAPARPPVRRTAAAARFAQTQ